jgi:hypothetical protein
MHCVLIFIFSCEIERQSETSPPPPPVPTVSLVSSGFFPPCMTLIGTTGAARLFL